MSTKDDEIEAKVVTTTDDKSQDKDVDKDEDVPQTFPQRVSTGQCSFVLFCEPMLQNVSSHYALLLFSLNVVLILWE
jgi:hypothetical protein